jgi:hypothetical protein
VHSRCTSPHNQGADRCTTICRDCPRRSPSSAGRRGPEAAGRAEAIVSVQKVAFHSQPLFAQRECCYRGGSCSGRGRQRVRGATAAATAGVAHTGCGRGTAQAVRDCAGERGLRYRWPVSTGEARSRGGRCAACKGTPGLAVCGILCDAHVWRIAQTQKALLVQCYAAAILSSMSDTKRCNRGYCIAGHAPSPDMLSRHTVVCRFLLHHATVCTLYMGIGQVAISTTCEALLGAGCDFTRLCCSLTLLCVW